MPPVLKGFWNKRPILAVRKRKRSTGTKTAAKLSCIYLQHVANRWMFPRQNKWFRVFNKRNWWYVNSAIAVFQRTCFEILRIDSLSELPLENSQAWQKLTQQEKFSMKSENFLFIMWRKKRKVASFCTFRLAWCARDHDRKETKKVWLYCEHWFKVLWQC